VDDRVGEIVGGCTALRFLASARLGSQSYTLRF